MVTWTDWVRSAYGRLNVSHLIGEERVSVWLERDANMSGKNGLRRHHQRHQHLQQHHHIDLHSTVTDNSQKQGPPIAIVSESSEAEQRMLELRQTLPAMTKKEQQK